MKSALTTFLIISFLGVAVFGFLSMIYGAGHGAGCIASVVGGSAVCPQNALAFLSHLNAFKYFSTAVLGVIFLILAVGLVFSIFPPSLNNDEDDFAFAAIRINADARMTRIKKLDFTNWLSLHINSPALVETARI